MAHDIPTPDWQEVCLLQRPGMADRSGPLADLVMVATALEPEDRPESLIVSAQLGELDTMQIEGLRRRPDFPGF